MYEIVGALEADAPAQARALADAANPLPPGTVFWPTYSADADGEAGYRVRALLAAGSISAICMAISVRWAGQLLEGTFAGDPVEAFLTLAMMMLFPLLWIGYSSWRAARNSRRQEPGRRRGIFLLPEHLVIYTGERYAVLRPVKGRFSVKARWRPVRRSWDFLVVPGFASPFRVEVDRGTVLPSIASGMIASYCAA